MFKNVIINKKLIFVYSLLIVMPLLCAVFSMIIHGIGLDFSGFVPVKNDEYMNWFPTLADYTSYGRLLGIPGYDGMQSPWGQGGVYPYFMYVPYIIFARLFGLSFQTMFYANIFWLCLSLAVLIILTRPDFATTLLLITAYCCSFFTISSSLSSMSEPIRLCMFIINSSIVIRWLRKECIKWLEFIFALVFLAYCSIAYNPTILFLPIFVMIFFKKIKPIRRLFISATALLIGGVIVLYIMSRILTPYFSSVLSDKLEVFNNEGIYLGICKIISDFIDVVSIMDVVSILGNLHGAYYSLFFLSYLLLTLYTAILVFEDLKAKSVTSTVFYTRIISIYLLIGTLFMEGLMHFSNVSTVSRVINNSLVSATLLLCFQKSDSALQNAKSDIPNCLFRIPKELIVVCSIMILGIPTIYQSRSEQFKAYYVGDEKVKYIEELRNKYSAILKPNVNTDDPWENTVAFYGGDDYLWNAMPGGLSRQLMLYNNTKNISAKYVVYRHYDSEEDKTHLEEILDWGNDIIYNDENFYIMINNKYL